MKKYLGLFLVSIFIFCASVLVFAQVAVDPTAAPSSDEIAAFLNMLGQGAKGVGPIILLAVQGIALVFRSKLGDWAGKWRLTLILGLTFVGSFVAAFVAGGSWLNALLSGTVLSALQVFGNQLFKQFATDKGSA